MTDADDQLKIHVRQDNTASLICPACGNSRLIDAAKFRHDRHTITVRCRCQHSFTVLLDFRRHYRKRVNLAGTYKAIGQRGVGQNTMQLDNISMGGVRFTVSGPHHLTPGQKLMLEFQLDDKRNTLLKKRAVVKSVQANTVGCQFDEHGEIEKALGFYLRP